MIRLLHLCALILVGLASASRAEKDSAELRGQTAVNTLVAACVIQRTDTDCLPAALKTCVESYLAPHASALFDPKPNPENTAWCTAELSKALQTSKSPADSEDITQLQAQDQINTLLAACLIGKRPTDCISAARDACFVHELAPIKVGWFSPKPVLQTMEWCDQAEMTAWRLRTQADIQKIRDRLGDRAEWRDFERQEAAWQAFLQQRGPYSTYDADHAFFGDPSEYLLPLVAARAIQVAKIAHRVEFCSIDAGGESACALIKPKP